MGKTGLKPIDELILLAKNDSGAAFTALWDRHIAQLKAHIKSQFKNIDSYTVDDICSRSFEKAFRQIGSYDRNKSQFFTWLCTIARNTALDAMEMDRRVHPSSQYVPMDDERQITGLSGIADGNGDPLGNLIKTEIEEERAKYIDRLPDLYRPAAKLRMLEGLKYEEIAESLDLNLNTVRTRISRARKIIDELRSQDEE